MQNEPKPIAPAIPASSILLVRDGPTGLEVLMMERPKTMKFAPGAYVFPGGKVDASDMRVWRWRKSVTDFRINVETKYKIAALRELHEEAGICLVENRGIARWSRQRNFLKAIERSQSRLDTAALVPFAHWVTPENMPRRFDTQFYIARHNGQEAKADGNEAVSLRWANPEDLLEKWEEDQIPLMFPTRLNLMKLARANSARQALDFAKKEGVVRTLPKIEMTPSGVRLSIPKESGYSETEATNKELAVERPR